MKNSFSNYRRMKKAAIKVLMNAGLSCREAINHLRSDVPHFFYGASKWREIDQSFEGL